MSTNLEDLNYLIMTEVLECMDVFDAYLAIRAKELEDAQVGYRLPWFRIR